MLRLHLAQYRELEAFSQFGSDLDKATLSQLQRGARLVEILKQPQYQPLPVEKQVLIILAATNGHLDAVPLASAPRYEQELYAFFETDARALLDGLRETQDLDGALAGKIREALAHFTANIWKDDGDR